MARWPHNHVEVLVSHVEYIQAAMDRRDALGALRAIVDLNQRLARLAHLILDLA